MPDKTVSKNLNSCYNAKDSGIVFSITVMALVVISVIAQAISEGIDGGIYLSSAAIQLTFLAVALLYTLRTKRSLRPLMLKKPELERDSKPLLMSVLLGVTMMFALLIPASLFQDFLNNLGYHMDDFLMPLETQADIIKALFFVALLPGICEELIFRGIILQGLRKFGDVFAVLVSALMFMLIHTNPEQTVFPFLSGIVLGFVFIKTGNIIFPMIIHFCNNALAIFVEYSHLEDLKFGEVDAVLTFVIAGAIVFAVVIVKLIKSKSVPACIAMPCKIVKHDTVGMLRLHGRVMRPNPNEYLNYTRSNLHGGSGEEGTYSYYSKKSAYYLFSPDAHLEETPPLFLDVSNNNYYNPGKTKRRTFFMYAITGIIICIVMWISVFALGIG